LYSRSISYLSLNGATVPPWGTSREGRYGLPDTVVPFCMSPKALPPYEDKFMRLLKADQLKIQKLLADTSSSTSESEIAREWILVGQEQYCKNILTIYRQWKTTGKIE